MIKPKVKESGPDVVVTLVQLIHTLLKDPEARQEFFTVTFCMYLWETKLFCFLTDHYFYESLY